ncbi:hypothetical protein FVR03_16535 [Pontibacter qinzhouensis]|uniref:Calcium-binding protein n=1 Tax=Pontibacter qinzhouensis TaxID=2603253 RepID=A0A5C8JH10_9BACT|nr:calcium-binding protein [Pontibacter qinzhouensis]TXK36898.1 hypothetical protein FVR03_16535 [Pontibacter qinzhouensis]
MLTKEEIQHKIDYEIIVDCYDETEVSMGWYYFFEENLEFPFKATVPLRKKDGSTEIKVVKVVALASDEEGITDNDFELEIENGEYLMDVSYSELTNIKASAQTREAFQIWDFWVK